MTNLPTRFLYGTAAYRPTNPPRAKFRKHMSLIKKELGFDLLRLRVQWNPINRLMDQFEFDELDELMDLAEEFGLQVFLEISLQEAPYWLEEAHPESRYVNAFGQAAELGPNESIQIGGYPGLCFHHGPVLEAGERFLRAVVKHFKGHKALLAYNCWNEPHLEPAWMSTWDNPGESLFCYCQGSKDAFRRWLAERYGDVETLNKTWGRAFRSWNDAQPPARRGHYADWLDWGRFWHDELREHMQWRYDILRDADPDRFIMSHSGAVPPFLKRPTAFIHNWKLAEPVDLWGTSLAPLYHNWSLDECAGTLEATRSAARGKPFWLAELSGGACYVKDFRRGPLPTARDLQTWNWLAVCCGAKASVHWCSLEERTGPESGGFGLIRANQEVTDRARGAAETARVLRDQSPLFFDYQPQPQVGILYDPDNSLLFFAMEADDELYCHSHIGYYRAVWRSDNFARYVTFDSLADLEGLRVLIVPMCMTMPQRVIDALASFVRKGGILLAEARTGHYDHRGYNRAVLPAGSLSEVVGAVEQEALCSDPENRPMLNNPAGLAWPDPIYSGPPIRFEDPVAAEIRTREYFVPLTCTTASPIAHAMDYCLATRNTYGQGTAYYVGTYLGLALHRGDEGAMTWMQALLDRHTEPPVRGSQLRPRLIDADDEALLVVFNDSRTVAVEETIHLPARYHKATDVYSDESISLDGQNCRVHVERSGVRVLRVSC